jgi:hypothetical protein
MTTSVDRYQLSNLKQLIDLNGDLKNFELNFFIKSLNNENFQALIVTQEMLDSGDKLQYQNSQDGVISGKIIADQNKYHNYLLLLKSDTPCEVEVQKEIKTISYEELQRHNAMMQQQQVDQNSNEGLKPIIKSKKSWFGLGKKKFFLYLIVAIIVIVFLIWAYNKFIKNKEQTSSNENLVVKGDDDLFDLKNRLDGGINLIQNNVDTKMNEISQTNLSLNDKVSNLTDVVQTKITDVKENSEKLFNELTNKVSESYKGVEDVKKSMDNLKSEIVNIVQTTPSIHSSSASVLQVPKQSMISKKTNVKQLLDDIEI